MTSDPLNHACPCPKCPGVHITRAKECTRCGNDLNSPRMTRGEMIELIAFTKGSYNRAASVVHRKRKDLEKFIPSKTDKWLLDLQEVYDGRAEMLRVEILFLKGESK